MDKEQTAIESLRMASEMSLKHYQAPLVVTTSGGKDSAVCIALAERAGIPFEAMHNHTTVDAPETGRFVREDFRRLEGKGVKCTINFPVYKGQRVTMWSLIPQKLMPPTRIARWAESQKRKENRGIYEASPSDKEKRIILNNDNDDRRLFETCTLKAKRTCNPIIDWTDGEVWDYIESEKLQINPLYKCGFSRVGCIGCPMAWTAGR